MAVFFVTFGGANTNSISQTLTCQVGDLIVETSWTSTSTIPTLATGMTNLGTLTSAGVSARMGYKVSGSTSYNGVTNPWTNGTTTMAVIYRGAGTPGTPTTNVASSTTVQFPALSLSTLARTSWCYRLAFAPIASLAGKTLTGYTARDTTTNGNALSFDSNGGLSGNPTADSLAAGATSAWGAFSVEIPALPGGRQFNQAVNRAAYF